MDTIRMAARHWDHLNPIALRDVTGSEPYTLDRRDLTPDLWTETDLDVAETSFSRYVQARAAGDDRVIALPLFVMRGFRHRCIITRADSPLDSAEALCSKRIGLTGWGDSGNTWTRAVLREAGVGITEAEWRVGALTADHPVMDRIGSISVPANVAATENDEPMMDMLERGALDAVMTPFMPPAFYEIGSPFRPLFRDSQQAEAEYFARVGFVPGIHLIGVRAELAENPGQLQELMDLFSASKEISAARRNKLLDITPWHNEVLAATTRIFGQDWMPYGWSANALMIDAFQTELVEQGIVTSRLEASDLFPYQLEPSQPLEKVSA
ncbi:hypothetical protein [Arthrobacter roseus]|uniref:hypothetical protein n=1 Tax=Arthrobacter roseus TaxID=136274 RepID=UPI001965B10C|nr:hypothetical protein [Arthrobacter roseus]MBM7847860.1 4,5-dihydroxyphthalate decarboxylase [Arthrobacter roseus]